ncbi:unnamed protein product [Arabidopsis halleri]
MNNRGIVADKISQLPEALILQILCLLPTKVAITTSVLSKQWQSHWKMMPKLKFDSFLHRLGLENVSKSLLSHKAPVLQSFGLKVRLDGRNNAVDIGILIGIAMTRNVRKLVLEVYFHRGSFAFPRSLYNCVTLETLKLILNVVMDVPSSVSLKSLRTLHLLAVDFKDDESVINLLSGCPNLQDLVMRRHSSSSVKTFTIVVPSLQKLAIHNGSGGQQRWGYVINTPSLKYLKLEGSKAFESFKIENVPELMELVYLELYTNKKEWWKLLPLVLLSSPKLQVLKLIDDIDCMNFVEASGVWNQPKNVPECLLFHLETFMWEGYKWKREEEVEVAKYILKNTNRLKKAIFSLKCVSSEERLVVVNDLKSVVRATTNSCQFQFI